MSIIVKLAFVLLKVTVCFSVLMIWLNFVVAEISLDSLLLKELSTEHSVNLYLVFSFKSVNV